MSKPELSQKESSFNSSSSEETSPSLSLDQKERMEQNRKRALDIRKAKEETSNKIAKLTTNLPQKKLINTGAGFYLDEEDLIDEQKKNKKVVELPPLPTRDEMLICSKCNDKFAHSYLSIHFDVSVCDGCKSAHSDEYELITKTEAKEEFMLKDGHFDFLEPPLKYFLKKNPHNQKWGEMKLYLKFQVRERAMEVYKDEETLEEKKELKVLNLHKTRQRNYDRKIKELRKQTRMASKKLTEFHKHDFGEEVYDAEKDVYRKTCKTCSFQIETEEM